MSLAASSPAADAEAPSPSHVLAARVRLAMIRLSRQLRRNDPSELSITQLSGLATVVKCGPVGIGQLADIEALPSPAATRLADKLEEAGLVARHANPTDRRGVLVAATVEGRELIARSERAGNAWLAERTRSLSEEDRNALERAVEVLEAMVAQPPGETKRAGEGPSAEPAEVIEAP